jgi:hypothetical protein
LINEESENGGGVFRLKKECFDLAGNRKCYSGGHDCI